MAQNATRHHNTQLPCAQGHSYSCRRFTHRSYCDNTLVSVRHFEGTAPVADRVVEHLDQRIITAGISRHRHGTTSAQLLVDTEAAKAMQLMIEYDPQPLSMREQPRSRRTSHGTPHSIRRDKNRDTPHLLAKFCLRIERW